MPRRHGRVGQLHQPVDDRGPERRRPLGLRPRHRRGGQHRRHPRDPRVHRRHGHAAARGHDGARHDHHAPGQTGTTSATTASFAFTSSESGSTFECKLDTAAWATCTSPKAYNGLTTGSHTFSVRATDAAGNTDSTPATQTWTIQSAPADHQPVAAYTYTPASPTIGQAVSFDASSATCDDTPCTYTWEDDGGDGPAGDQWPLGSGKTMSFTFQEAGVKNVRVTVTDADGDTATTMKADHGRRGRPAGRHDGARHDDQLRPDRHHHRQHADLRVHLERERVDVPVPARLGGVGELHQPVDDGDAGRRRAQRLRPRHRRRGQRRRDAGHAGVHGRHDAAGRHHRARTPRLVRARPVPPTTPRRRSRSRRARAARRSSAASTPARGRPAPARGRRRRWPTAPTASRSARPTRRATPTPRPRRARSRSTRRPRTPRSTRRPPALSPGSSATVAFSASESGATFECRLDGGAWAACTSPKTYTGLGLAQHTVDVRATDAAGNVDASPASASWTSVDAPGRRLGRRIRFRSGSGSGSDSEAPTVTLSAPSAGATFTSTLNMAATASDNRGVSKVEFWFDGARVSRDTALRTRPPSRPAGGRPTACTPSRSGPSTPRATRARRRHGDPRAHRSYAASARARPRAPREPARRGLL